MTGYKKNILESLSLSEVRMGKVAKNFIIYGT